MAVAKAKPLTIKQQAINQVAAAGKVGTAAANAAAAKAMADAQAQAKAAQGFQDALADMNQGDAGRIHDAYANAAERTSAYGNLALSSAGSSANSAAQQAQNYIGTVGPDVGVETRPEIGGALRALGALGVSDPAVGLRGQAVYAQERARNTRDAQLMRLADIGTQAMYQGREDANTLRSEEVKRQAASRQADVNAAITALKTEARASGDQRMKEKAFKIELQQRKVDLAATRLANATGEIEKKKAQKELDNYQKQLDAELRNTDANTKATLAGIGDNKPGIKGLTPYQQTQAISKAHDAAALMHTPPPRENLTDPQPKRLPYQQAVQRLTGKYGLTKAQAVDVLNTYYRDPGKDGRPVFDFQERAKLVKLGFSKKQVTQAMNGYIQSQRTGKPTPGYKLYEKMLDRLG